MTAAPWWVGLDDPALAALGSVGLLRRAKVARVGVATVAGATAEVAVEGFTVTLGAKGVGSARCPCPATGLCLHILAAIMALQSGDPATTQADVATEIATLPEAGVLAFAGSDLAAALRLVRGGALPDIGDPASSLTLTLAGLPHPVTFVAGAGLRGAIWKGPDSRRRLAVAAAALAVRAARGAVLPTVAADAEADTGFDATLLATITAEVAASVTPVLAGCGALAADGLLDLALSARIDAAPRLAGALRGLVQLAIGLDDRKAGTDATTFLIAAARAQALAHAMSGPDPDPRLAGLLRREYRPVPPLTLCLLGARHWRSAAGARGLRLWGWDPIGARWITTGAARPDGLDMQFDPVTAFRRPMLGLPSAAQAVGQVLGIAAPLMSDDLRLAADCIAVPKPVPIPALSEETDWDALRGRLRAGLGPALLRDGQMQAALLAPTTSTAPVRDASGLCLPLRDARGRLLHVALDGLPTGAVTALGRLPPRARLLVEVRDDLGHLRFDLVSVLHGPQGTLVWNPTLDPPPVWPEPGWLAQVIPWAGTWRKPATPLTRHALSDDLLLAALDIGQGQPPAPALVAQIAKSGIAALDRLLCPPATPSKALCLAWIAAELRGNAQD